MQKESQENNIIRIDTPAGKDAFYLTHFTGKEAFSELFSFTASMFTVGSKVGLSDLVGKPITVSLENGLTKGVTRYFHGIISHLESSGMRTIASEDYLDYQAVIVPNAAFMKKRTNCRIYQNLSVDEIFSDLFSQHQVAFQNRLTKTYPKYEYCVQYQESDYDFIARILQQEGIFFFFEHSQSAHTLVLADDITVYNQCAESQVECFSGDLTQPHVSRWQGALNMVYGAYERKGYDFEAPGQLPKGNKANASLPSQGSLEVFDYQGESELNTRAQPIANVQLDALQKDMEKCLGQSDCRSFSVGQFFTFKKHENSDYTGKSYVVTALKITAAQASQTGSSTTSGMEVYINDFECVPKETAYRPVQLTQKPLINGVQTAIVTGDPGDEQHIDRYGRVKVQFHWDREGELDSKSSCWIRVGQNWAGDRWGAFFFPRVGQEVLVEFINGDPEQPIICGAVYNSDLMPPYSLPGKKTQSGIKTRSTKEGGADNFNEMRFEDEKGKELLFFQAEKDHHLNIKNDQKDTIGNDRLTEVINNDTVTVSNDRLADISNNDTVKVGKNLLVEAGQEIIFKTGSASIKLESSGNITISGTNLSIEGTNVSTEGTNVTIDGTAIALSAAQIKLN
ncbi:type VI secretion system tip protein VgrG [Pseudoalteromonas sp. C2R02]|uniref:type VI secretion system tip protein TssI/VgrG n=1 Tax=Pseudoalteromonas sp. C2R02 TaxID=2841565 RepID=UPI001C08E046|nr:type VI secretion system tip protein TssI/VgrG [Pseudoalteromonas sp. C2R02]MBU2968400.1 type VI secretion system tip protein VgrG [Pseudoalteromonas sp. C2R02]